jgi:NAD(P)H-flavin reductase
MKAGIFTTTIEKLLDLGVQETRHFKLVFEPGTVFDFDAGQFVNVMAEIPAVGKVVKRPYSIDSPPYEKGYIDLVWKRVENGLMTNYLWTLKEGDKLRVQGPLGRFGLKKPVAPRLVFVATGTGIAPFRSMILQMFKEGTDRDVWLIFGNRYETDILYDEDWKALARKHPNFHYVPTVSRPMHWTGETAYVQKVLQKTNPSPENTHIYICGLTNMINEVVKTAQEMGFGKDHILFEKYD